jgi:hypothetical protein
MQATPQDLFKPSEEKNLEDLSAYRLDARSSAIFTAKGEHLGN